MDPESRDRPGDEPPEAVSALLPLRVDELSSATRSWCSRARTRSLSIVCPWRFTRGGALVTSIEDPGAEARLRDLVGATIIEIVAQANQGRLAIRRLFLRTELASNSSPIPIWIHG